MVREIEFRGKSESRWIYSKGYKQSKETIALFNDDWEWRAIEPNTLGQYTGLKDKNGTKIFEGDIVELYCIRTYCGRQVSKYDIPTKCRVVVRFTKCWNGYGVGFMFDYNNKFNESVCQPIGNEQNERELWKRAIGEFVYDECHKKHDHPKWIWKDHIEVIGNVIDNPELLGE